MWVLYTLGGIGLVCLLIVAGVGLLVIYEAVNMEYSMFITVLAWVGGMTFIVLAATGLWVLIGLVNALIKGAQGE